MILQAKKSARRTKRIWLVMVLLTLALSARAQPAVQNENKPISEEGLLMLLEQRIPSGALIRAIERRGVSFQLTSVSEQEFSDAGQYLGSNGLKFLLTTVRGNFRPPANRPYRLTYRLLEGHAIDLLMDRKIGRQWDRVLGARYFIVQNEVLKTLTELVNTFSDEFSGDKFFREDRTPRTSRRLASQYKIQNKRMFVGSSGNLPGGQPSTILSADKVLPLVNLLNDSKEEWRFQAFRSRRSDLFSFWKFASRRDLEMFPSTPLQEFYLFITKNYFPRDFGSVLLDFHEQFGCDEGFDWSGYFFGPLLRLNVAILENVSGEPMNVGRFIIEENHSDRLRTRQEISVALQSRQSEKEYLFSPGILKSGESIVIPIELSLLSEELAGVSDEGKRAIPPTGYADLLRRVTANGGIKATGTGYPTISAETLQRLMLGGNKRKVSAGNEYLYGPSVRVESIEINKVGYLIRQFDPSRLLITSGTDEEVMEEIGSCPYVYTYSAPEKAWLSEGVILYGFNSKLKESTDELVLERFNGKLIIVEKDPEDSFIDMAYIKAFTSEGREIILKPKNTNLLYADNQYLKLKQGGQVIVDFEIPSGLTAKRYSLVASGYYLPYGNEIHKPFNGSSRRQLTRKAKPRGSSKH